MIQNEFDTVKQRPLDVLGATFPVFLKGMERNLPLLRRGPTPEVG
jgi:hypothetical protein